MNDYQQRAKDYAVYPRDQYPHQGLIYCALGLGDAGELQGKVSKLIRGDGELDEARRMAIMLEAGDVLWFLAGICTELGVDMSTMALANLSKLEGRRLSGAIKGDGDER